MQGSPGCVVAATSLNVREGVGSSSNGEPLKVLRHQKHFGKLSFGKSNLAAGSLK